MYRYYKLLIIIIIFSLPLNSHAHLEHYKDLNNIKFDIYRNNKHIGSHVFRFNRIDDVLEVNSKVFFEIKKLGVVLYNYHVEGKEIYKEGKLIKFNSKTDQNGKKKFVNLTLDEEDYKIDGSSYKGNVPNSYMIGTWWNHSLVKSEAQISAVSGRIIKQKVTFIGKEKLKINGKDYNTLHFNFSSTDKKLKKNKKLNTNIWYDENSLNWVKATFKKSGNWEYRLIYID